MKTEHVKNYQGYGSYDSLSVCGSDRKSSLSDPESDRKSSLSDPEFDPISDEEEEEEDNDYKSIGLEDSEIDGLTDRMTGIKLVPRAPMKHIDNYRDNLRNSTIPWAVQTQNTVTPSGGRVLNNFAQNVLTTNLQAQNNRLGANVHAQNVMTTNLQAQNVMTKHLHPQNAMSTNQQRQNVMTTNLRSPSVMITNVQGQNVMTANLPGQNVMTSNLQSHNLPITSAQSQNILTTNLNAYNNNNYDKHINFGIFNNNVTSVNNNNSPPRNVYQTAAPVWADELEEEIKGFVQNALQDESSRDTDFSSSSFLALSIPLDTDTLPQLSKNDLDEILGIDFFNADDDETRNIIAGDANKNGKIETLEVPDYSSPLSVGSVVPPSVTSSNCSSPANVDFLLSSSPNVQCCTPVSAALSPNPDYTYIASTTTAAAQQAAELSSNMLRPIAVSSTTTTSATPNIISAPTFTANICHSDLLSIISSTSTLSSFHEARQQRTSISTNSTPSHPGSSEYSPVSEPQHSPYSSTPDLYHRFSPNIIDAQDTIIPVTVNEDTGDAEDSSRSSSSRKSSNQDNVSAKDRLLQKFLADPRLRQEKKKAYLNANLKAPEELLTFIPSLVKSTDHQLEVKLYTNMEVFVYNASREQITTLFRTVRFLHLASVQNNALLSGYIREVMLDHDIEPEDYAPIINGAW